MGNRYHSSKTGKFVSKEFAEANPETTVKISSVNLKEELLKFLQHINNISFSDFKNDQEVVDKYLNEL